MSFRAPRPAGCRVLWLKAEPEAAGIPGSALHRSPGMADVLSLCTSIPSQGSSSPSEGAVMHWHRLPRGHCAQNTLWALRWQWAQSGGVGDLGGLFQP